ncbi:MULTISPECIES: mammalian cell entry protein [unclassified Mycolicibacterium]|uniref:mammalian cell entry protein n=1 Tax=unclassified Mycolicibacterium TaxID=2636767 RepID=UPI0012DF7272|nr:MULTISPECIES: mammalian cell entry protein [unclassified Mycolicibacterium]MUL83917.1 mammalian cell entry protein [Mycolicibacterium sp. CBMA 329]MUL90017.1 mammalian cell entry protein [Mycolicibacterium sp. CBMA 331]MUL97963.1 mammalian cell entry protein [Mycolicibacterium sp. CBMA 334]MUM27895.1 mammalian cell entry protein [Mycolicibacterium sp. CBMA 295]MUM39532.1 mammalian cell entry protein [Mycolicibacterium sp. CBMA 247]
MIEETASNERPVRRRASRAAGPTGAATAGEATTTTVRVESSTNKVAKASQTTALKAPPRRRAHGSLVALVAAVVLVLGTAALGALAYVMRDQQQGVDAVQARDERFVDTGKQTVINMFSYTQDTIDESVNRFIDGTSGPLRDMMSQGNNADNLKALFRDTNASSEAVVNGAALEKVDDIAGNASVLVAVRVTVADLDGVNSPTRPYRLRVIVHEDDNGHMTGYDLKYPDGGN